MTTAGPACRAAVLASLLIATSAFAALPPYDVTGSWDGAILAAGDVFLLTADLTPSSAKKFTGTATISNVPCELKGKRKGKVKVKVTCADGTRAKLKGVLDIAASAIAGSARLSRSGQHTRGTFTIEKTVATVCGNSALESGEQCDDGNVAAGDGCSATCTVEVASDVAEVEPNEDSSQATPIPALPGLVHGAIASIFDLDFFRIEITGPDLTLETFDANGPGACNGLISSTDTYLELRGPDGVTIVAEDDDSGLGYCSKLVLHDLLPGTYYPCVRATFVARPVYTLLIR